MRLQGPVSKASTGRALVMAATVALLAVALSGCGGNDARAAAAPLAPATNAAAPTKPGELTTGPVMRSATPTSVAIPRLKVSSALTPLGRSPDGTMQVPVDAGTVGWFTGAPTPGALGPAVLAGHVDWKGKKGAFAQLTDLAKGDEITVERGDGSVATFGVTSVERHPKDRFPTAAVYGPIDHAGLRLITCGGEFDSRRHHYRDNIVVFADLRAATAPKG
jgi:Sortase domain